MNIGFAFFIFLFLLLETLEHASLSAVFVSQPFNQPSLICERVYFISRHNFNVVALLLLYSRRAIWMGRSSYSTTATSRQKQYYPALSSLVIYRGGIHWARYTVHTKGEPPPLHPERKVVCKSKNMRRRNSSIHLLFFLRPTFYCFSRLVLKRRHCTHLVAFDSPHFDLSLHVLFMADRERDGIHELAFWCVTSASLRAVCVF